MNDPMSAEHYCIKCKTPKSVRQFRRRNDTGRMQNTCRPCELARNRDYARNGPQKYGRYQKFDQPDGRRQCRICGDVKELEQFQIRQSKISGTRRNECRPCFLNLARERYARNPAKHRDVMRRAMYGLQPGDYDRMHAKQNGRCAICGDQETSPDRRTGKPRGLFVDHHHVTGRVRDLLCMRCNMGIGQFRDDPELLAKAIAYLNRHSQ